MNPNSKSPVPKIRLEKRTGSIVTIIAGLHTYGRERLHEIAKALKSSCGTGGTVKNGTIEIQGDKAGQIRVWFAQNKSPNSSIGTPS